MNNKFSTMEEIAEFLQVNKRTINRLIEKGFPAFKVGKQWRFVKEEVQKWISMEDQKKNKTKHLANYSQDTNTTTIEVPVIGTIAAGLPILAEENIEANVKISTDIVKPNNKYFILKVKGTSMNELGINDEDKILVKQQNIAKNGDIVVALVDSEATVKEFQYMGNTVVLKPHSTDPVHQPIYVTENLLIQGVYVMTLPKV